MTCWIHVLATKIIFDMLDSCPAQYGHPNVGASARSRTRWFHFHVTPNYRPRSLDAERPKFQRSSPLPQAAPVILPFLCVVRMGSMMFTILRQDDCLGSDTDWSHEVSTWIQKCRGSWGRTRNQANQFALKVCWQTLPPYQHGSQHANEVLLRSFDPARHWGESNPLMENVR